MSKSAIVIYHANCMDGFGSAWAFHILKEPNYKSVQYVPMAYGQDFDSTSCNWMPDAHIYILDFSFNRAVLKNMSEKFSSIVVLDHHKTAQDELENWADKPDNVTIVFDMNRSGAGITWDVLKQEHFHYREPLINYIEDRDLWKFQLKDSKLINAYIASCDKTFESYTQINNWLINDPMRVSAFGQVLLRQQEQHVQSILKLARPCTITLNETTYSGLVCNCNGQFASDVGNELAKQSGTFGASYFTDNRGVTKWSLRSIGDYDVSRLAKQFGGGGHVNAAGFETPAEAGHGVGVKLWSIM